MHLHRGRNLASFGYHFVLECGSLGGLAIGFFGFGHACLDTLHHVVLEGFDFLLFGIRSVQNRKVSFGLGQEFLFELGHFLLFVFQLFQFFDMLSKYERARG